MSIVLFLRMETRFHLGTEVPAGFPREILKRQIDKNGPDYVIGGGEKTRGTMLVYMRICRR